MTPAPAPTATPTAIPATATPIPPTPTATPIPATPTPSVVEGEIVAAGPGVTPPVRLQVVDPKYPPMARQMRYSGTVNLQALIGIDGSVEQIRITKVDRSGVGFEKASEEAVKQWKYKPATKHGVKVRMWVPVRVPFLY